MARFADSRWIVSMAVSDLVATAGLCLSYPLHSVVAFRLACGEGLAVGDVGVTYSKVVTM